MPAEEAVLFLIVTVLSFALVATVVAPLIRKKRTGVSATRARGAAATVAGFAIPAMEGPRCATCRRGLLPGFRFCPFDGTPLLPDASPAARPPQPQESGAAGVPKKICPRCARAYRQDSAVCAHDGIPLVPVN